MNLTPEKMAELVERAAKLGDPAIVDELEFRVTIELCAGDTRNRWLSLQANPEVISAFLASLAPNLAKFPDMMHEIFRRAQVIKD